MTAKCRGCNQDLNNLRFLYNARHCPGLSLGNWTSFMNFNHVAFFGLVCFFLCLFFFVLFVVFLVFLGCSFISVLLIHYRLNACDVAAHFFELSGIVQLLRRDLHAQAELRLQQIVQLLRECRLIFAAEFRCFHVQPQLLADLANDKRRRQRQFSGSQTERFAGERLIDTVHFVQYLAVLDFFDIVFRITFAVTHTNFCRLLRNLLVRKNANPDTAATLDVTSHCTTCSFNLTCGDATTADCLQTEFAEGDGGTPIVRDPFVTALLLFTIFSACWLQHGYSPAFSAGAAPSGFLARTRLAAGAAPAGVAGAAAWPSARLARGGRPAPGLPSSRRGARRFFSSSEATSTVGASPLARRSPL